MRIDSGLQGYYYEQGRFKRPNADAEDASAAPQQQQPRAASFAPLVESSTVLSSSLSSALWAMESVRDPAPASGGTGPLPLTGATDEETASKVRALYMEYSDGAGPAAGDSPA
nr:hypothetical protein [uncultured Gellertiella sp.]